MQTIDMIGIVLKPCMTSCPWSEVVSTCSAYIGCHACMYHIRIQKRNDKPFRDPIQMPRNLHTYIVCSSNRIRCSRYSNPPHDRVRLRTTGCRQPVVSRSTDDAAPREPLEASPNKNQRSHGIRRRRERQRRQTTPFSVRSMHAWARAPSTNRAQRHGT
jgi:hypothetical protein